MTWPKKISREFVCLVFSCTGSLLFWGIMALITEHSVIIPEHLYSTEKNAFLSTIVLIYLIRLSVRITRSPSSVVKLKLGEKASV